MEGSVPVPPAGSPSCSLGLLSATSVISDTSVFREPYPVLYWRELTQAGFLCLCVQWFIEHESAGHFS